MKNPLSLVVGLSLSLSFFPGTSVLGQTAQLTTSISSQVLTVDAPSDLSETSRAGTVGTLGQWLAGPWARHAQRGVRPYFRLQLGRTFSITVPKH